MCVFGYLFFGGIDLENGEKARKKRGEKNVSRVEQKKFFDQKIYKRRIYVK